MFILGHLGIGLKLCSPWYRGLSRKAILVGTLLPDVIDKIFYYSMSWMKNLSGEQLGLISGTRTFGHTGVLLLTMSVSAVAARSRLLAALALGMATHLILDNLGDHFTRAELLRANQPIPTVTTLNALFWPFLGNQFPVLPYRSISEHLGSIRNHSSLIWGEIIGALLLGWEFWKTKWKPRLL